MTTPNRFFSGTPYRDPFWLAVAETTNTIAVAPRGFLATDTSWATDSVTANVAGATAAGSVTVTSDSSYTAAADITGLVATYDPRTVGETTISYTLTCSAVTDGGAEETSTWSVETTANYDDYTSVTPAADGLITLDSGIEIQLSSVAAGEPIIEGDTLEFDFTQQHTNPTFSLTHDDVDVHTYGEVYTVTVSTGGAIPGAVLTITDSSDKVISTISPVVAETAFALSGSGLELTVEGAGSSPGLVSGDTWTLTVTAALPSDAITMGAADGLQVIIGGTDANNETVNYQICGVSPLKDADGITKGYYEFPIATGTATFGNTTAGADLAAAIDGIDSGDFLSDTYTLTANKFHSDWQFVNGADTPAWLEGPAMGAEYITIQLDRGTAATAWALVRRTQGNSFPQ